MSTTVKTGWLNDKNGDKFAPKTLTSQVQTSDGTLLEDKIQADIDVVSDTLNAHTSNSNIHFTSTERTKLSNIESGAQKNTVTGVKGNAESSYRTGNINITPANIGLGNVNNTSDANKPVSTAQQTAINTALNEAKSYTNTKTSSLASTSYVDDINSNIQTQLDGKANTSHAHDDIYYTEAEVDTKISNVNTSITNHTGNSSIHVTSDNKTQWNSAYSHSTSAHAPTNAEKNIIIGIQKNGTDLTVNSSTRKVNITVPTTAAEIGAASSTHNHDSAYDTKGAADTALASAKEYADSAATTAANAVKSDLLNGAGGAYDTLKELGDLINDNTDAIDALETVAAGKADKTHSHVITDVTNLQSTLDGKLAKTGGQLNTGATLKFDTYGDRFLTIGGNSISVDMSQTSGGWAGSFASVKDPADDTTTMLGWYGGTEGLTHIFMGGSYSDPAMKMTKAGQFTFKNAPNVGSTPVALSTDLDSHTADTTKHITATERTNWNAAYTHSQVAHARTDATKVADSTTNGNILINGAETNVYSHPNSGVAAGTYKSVTVNAQGHVTAGSNPTTLSGYGITDAYTKSQVDTTVSNLNTAINGKATTGHTHSYGDLEDLPTIPVSIDDLEEGGGCVIMTEEERDKLDQIEQGANYYVHPTHTTHSSGLYKITVDEEGHVSDVTAVAKSDITALGIPSTDTTYSAGSSNKTGTKMYLVAGTSQSSSGVTTYSNSNCYIGTDNRLYSNNAVVPNIDEITELIEAKLAEIPNASGVSF